MAARGLLHPTGMSTSQAGRLRHPIVVTLGSALIAAALLGPAVAQQQPDQTAPQQPEQTAPQQPGQTAPKPSKTEVEGVIEDLSGTCPSVTFTVAGATVVVDSRTRFDDGSCTDLANGKRVEVDGMTREKKLHAIEVDFDHH